jgi:hypothetical protein
MNQYAALMLELPQRLDEALTLVAEERTPKSFTRETYKRKNSSVTMAALLLMLAAFVLLVQHPGVTMSKEWADSIKALVFVALGACVLRAATRA